MAAHAPNASGSDFALTPAMNPAAHPPAAALSASSVYLSALCEIMGHVTYLTDVRDSSLSEGKGETHGSYHLSSWSAITIQAE
jgi:hypothetical protein